MPKDPVFLKIPIQRIRPNPNQPRRFITQSAIDAMEASLRTIGQQTPAKVRALTEAERLVDPDHDYELIGGHIRHAGALKAGLVTLDCLVLDLTPDQAELAGLVDNQTTDMHWLDWVIAIEKLNQGPAKLKQQQIADQLGVTQARVNYALKVAKALTPASRNQIYKQLIKLGPEKVPAERAVLALADLGDPKEVERAMPIFLARKMTAPQAKTLVKHLKDGRPLEDYHANGNHNGPLAQPNHAPRLMAPAQVPSTQSTHTPAAPVPTPEHEETFAEILTEMKVSWKKEFGTEATWQPYFLFFIFFGILGGMGWVALKVLGWLIHLS